MYVAILILTSRFLSAQASISLGPRNTEAVIGTDVTLRCSLATQQSSACSVEWSYKRRTWDPFQLIYTSCSMIGEFGTRHTVVKNCSNGQFNLKITNVSLEDSGTYTCLDNTDGDHQRAQLVVFDSYPSTEFCSVIAPRDGPIGNNTCGIEPDEVKLSCKMSFSGNAIPIMEWIQTDGDILASNITTITKNSVTVSTLVLSAARIQSTAYTCRIKYLQPRLESKISWSAKPRIVHMMKRKETLLMSRPTSSQEFDCAKGGLPGNCSFSWKHDGNKLPDSGPVLTLTEEMTGNYTCSAMCSIRGRSCSITQDLVIINDRQSSRMTVIMFAAVTGVLLILLLVGTSYVIRTRCRFLPKICICNSGEERCHECHDGIPKCTKPNAYHDHDSLMLATANVAR